MVDSKLIERIEDASGPDRELDALIRCAVFARPGAYVRQSTINGAWCIFEVKRDGKERLWEPHGLSQLQRLGEFTGSLDAAMTLARSDAEAFVILSDAMVAIEAAGWPRGEWVKQLPRFICAAALRSRSSS